MSDQAFSSFAFVIFSDVSIIALLARVNKGNILTVPNVRERNPAKANAPEFEAGDSFGGYLENSTRNSGHVPKVHHQRSRKFSLVLNRFCRSP